MDPISSLTQFTVELTLIFGLLYVLCADLLGINKQILGLFAMIVIAGAACYVAIPERSLWLFSTFLVRDKLSVLAQLIALCSTALVIGASIQSKLIPEKQKGEFYVLMISLAFLLILMGSTTHLLMIFLAIESVSLTSYILTGFQKFNKRASEASLKYLLFGAVSSAIMLFGMSLLFGITGSLQLYSIAPIVSHGSALAQTVASVALVLMLVGFGFKISMAPFHAWAPDVYEGAPTPIAGFLTVAPKGIGFLVLFRVLHIAFPALSNQWSGMLIVLSMLTMTIGNVIAVSQSNVKRLLAYSSIAQAGYILMGLSAVNTIGAQGILIYLIAYLFTNLGAFLIVAIVEQSENNARLEAFYGLGQRNPFLALALTVFMLSLAGMPPLAGFIAKWYVFAGAIEKKLFTLAIVAALNSAVAGFYYFRIIKAMYLTAPEKTGPITRDNLAFVTILVALLGVAAIGLCPSPVIGLARSAITGFALI